MPFIPRLRAPDWTSPYWINTAYGGYNRCIVNDNDVIQIPGAVVPNCVGYAWGRFLEILGATNCYLSTGDAGTWYGHNDGYARGPVPYVGAVACWSRPGYAGHVAIVEKVNDDGSIILSESGWSSTSPFWISTQYPPNYYSTEYHFQGFIYNPLYLPGSTDVGVQNKLVQFINVANSIIGKDAKWVWETSGLGVGQPWCVATIIAIAKIVGGLLNVCITNTYGTSSMCRLGVANGYGTWLPGPYQGVVTIPQVGDFVTFRRGDPEDYVGYDKYQADHIEIVVEVESDGTSFKTVAGNSGNGTTYTRKVKYNYHSTSSGDINGYFRPFWYLVGGSYVPFGYASTLYNFLNTRADATLREIAYMNSAGEPSINLTSNNRSYPLSVINFTPMIGALYNLLAPALGIAGGQYGVIDNLDNTAKAIVQYLVMKELPVSSAIGILANCYAESGLRLDAEGDDGDSFGLFQWNEEAERYVKDYVGADWATNLTGQMDFLWYELTSDFPTMLAKLYTFPNTESGAREAAKLFMIQFERPLDQSESAQEGRADIASRYWNQIAIQTVTEVFN